MLRISIRSARALGSKPVATHVGRQWQVSASRRAIVGQRCYANDGKSVPHQDAPADLAASEALTSATTHTSSILPKDVPLTPTAPETVDLAAPPPLPRPRRPGFFRRLRNYVLTLAILGALAFGSGVWYSRVNDAFHDFFTNYVPFGELAVLYLEELDFRKRFPDAAASATSWPRDAADSVRIPAQSGASWRVANGGEAAGRQSSAVGFAQDTDLARATEKKQEPAAVAEARQMTAKLPVTEAKEDSNAKHAEKAFVPATVAPASADKTAEKQTVWKAPEVDEPSRWPPPQPIDPLAVPDADEPVVQELVRMLNDIITVVNADGDNAKYGRAIAKAKQHLDKVGGRIRDIKAAVEKEAASQVHARVDEFERAATGLIERVDAVMAAQEAEWRRELEKKMERLASQADAQLQTAIRREQEITQAQASNKLLAQAVALRRQFAQEVHDQVEQEREGRLGKLSELADRVKELEKLTREWDAIVDTNLQTQRLLVAVEAVKASLEQAGHPRPFIKELVALKEMARDDAVINAAIESIPPAAYQRGIAIQPELIDRFRRVANEVRKASLLPEDAGVASHVSSLLLSKLMFKKQGVAQGDDVESILTRTQTYLEEGNLDEAAREMNGLIGWAKVLSKDWLIEVRKALEVKQALEVIQAEARLQTLQFE